MGMTQGIEFKDSIKHIISVFPKFEEYHDTAGKYGINAKKLISFLGKIVSIYISLKKSKSRTINEWLERVDGIGEGANINSSLIRGIQALESVLSLPAGVTGCTTIAIAPTRSSTREPIMMKNYDLAKNFRYTTILRISCPSNRLKSFEMALNLMPGSHIAMNESGLCISYNYGMVRFYPQDGIFPSYLVQYAIENFQKCKEATEWILEQKSTHGCIITVMDADGNICVIEKAGFDTSVRYPHLGITAATNHFLTPEMKKFNYNIKDKFSSNAPRGVRGISIQETNVRRLERANLLLSLKEKFSLEDILKITKDHEGKENGDSNTICRHHPYMDTLASVILLPLTKKVLICKQNPCKSSFVEINPFNNISFTKI